MDAREDSPNGWQLFTFGDFRLLDSSGQRVALGNRKLEALLAVLAVNRQFGVERDPLAEILWPERHLESQRSNLRQALSLLRRLLGEDALQTTRSHIRLSSALNLKCDYDDPLLAADAVFMPGHEGRWFDEIREDRLEEPVHVQVGNSSNFPGSSVAGHFQDSVEILAAVDVRGMFDQLRANPSMTRGLPYQILRGLVDRSNDSELNRGWADFWRGTATDDLLQSGVHLRSAMRAAKRTQDYELASEVSLELGRVYCRTGNLEKTERMCAIAETLADLVKTRAARANADRLRGTYLVNWGDSKKGLLLIQKTEDMTDSAVGRGHLAAVRAFFSASVGDYRRAETLISSSAQTAPILGHVPTLILLGLSRAMLTISGGCPEGAVPELERLSQWSRQLEMTQTAVYAEELLERIYERSGDRSLSRSRLVSAQQGRRKAQMILTPMEAKRLTSVQ